MPTENELKFVLKLSSEKLFEERWQPAKLVIQGYLASSKGMGLRIRRQDYCGNTTCSMTLKQKVKGRLVEIETQISERDFADLWEVAINKLEKKRYSAQNYGGNTWDVDFFKDHHHQTYFAQAEVEMPEGKVAPEVVPDIVKNNIIFAVPRDDNRFGSKKLAHIKHAKNLLKEISEHL